MNRLLSESCNYKGELKKFDEVLGFIPFLTDIEEDDYIIYYPDHRFEYTPRFHEFIDALSEAKLVEDYQAMLSFLEEAQFEMEALSLYNAWLREMNRVLCRPDMLEKASLAFIRKVFLTMIRLEKIIPGSWGIDVEVGTWLKLLRRLSIIRTEITSCHGSC